LFALPVASCGLKLDDEVVRVAVALRLGLNIRAPHTCRYRATVDALFCKQAPSRIAIHQHLNDLVTRALMLWYRRASLPQSTAFREALSLGYSRVLRRCRSSRTSRGGGNGCHQEMSEVLLSYPRRTSSFWSPWRLWAQWMTRCMSSSKFSVAK